MKGKLLQLIFAAAIVIALVSVIAACSSPTPPPPQPTKPAVTVPTATTAPALDGASLAESRCTVCHNLDRVKRGGKNKDAWTATVTRMVGKGAKLDAAEQTVLIEYLAKTYP